MAKGYSSFCFSLCKFRGGGQGGLSLPYNFQNNENKCVFYKYTIKLCVSCSKRCSGTSTLLRSTPDGVLDSLYFWKQHARHVKGP